MAIPMREVVVEFRLATRLHPSEVTGLVERGLRSLGVIDRTSEAGSTLVGPVMASIEPPDTSSEPRWGPDSGV